MTHRPYTPPAWQAKPLADGRVTLLVVPLKVQPFTVEGVVYTWTGKDSAFLCGPSEVSANLMKHGAAQYAPGDLIWCRETWAAWDGCPPAVFKATDDVDPYGGWKSPITMPKWAARTWLCCTGVEVRRVQTITAYEAERVDNILSPQAEWGGLTHRFTFEVKWNRQHGPKPAVDLSFDANPWAAFIAVEKISKEDV